MMQYVQFNLVTIIAGVIMAVCFIGMIICANKQQVSPVAKPTAVALMVVVMFCAITILWKTGIFGDTTAATFMKNEEVYANSKGIVLGRYLAEKAPGTKALLVVDNISNNKMQEQIIRALKEGIGDKITIVAEDSPAEPQVIPEATEPEATEPEATEPEAKAKPRTTTPPTPPPPKNGTAGVLPSGRPAVGPNGVPSGGAFMEMLSLRDSMKAVNFDAMLKRHPECNLIISLIGLPMDVENMEIWYAEETPETPKPKIALMDANIYNLKSAISSGIVIGTVTYSPAAKYDESKAPTEIKQAFDKRFLLVTPENVEAIATQYTGLFQ